MNCMEPLDASGKCAQCADVDNPPNATHQLPQGTVLNGRYLIGRTLGQGGFGITYIARDQTLGLRVAIKEFYPSGYANRSSDLTCRVTVTEEGRATFLESGKHRFLDEARVLAQFCETPGVVEVRDYFEANNTAYIVMSYLDGEDLRARINKGTLSADQAFKVMEPIMDALEKIHDKGVVHRDISPDNIMILRDGTLRLMDFGAARLIDYSDQRSVSVMLKAGYAPEEQYRPKGNQGPWTDIYALCATVYKAVTGVTPDDSLQRLYKDEIKWPSELNVPITAVQEAALRRGMNPRAEDRFQSISEMRDFLQGKGKWVDKGAGRVSEQSAKGNDDDVTYAPTEAVDAEATFNKGNRADDLPTYSPTRLALDGVGYRTDESADSGEDGVKKGGGGGKHKREEHQLKKQGRKGVLAGVVSAVAALAIAVLAFVVPPLLVPPVYVVDFETGEGSDIPSQEVTGGDAIDAPEDPTLKNHVLAGWFLDDARQVKAEFPLTVNSDTTLHAAWDEILVSYTVKYVDKATRKEIREEKVVSGNSIGAKVTEKAPAIDGYKLSSEKKQELKTAATEKKNVITFEYRKLVGYTVRYVDQSTGNSIADDKQMADKLEGDEVTEEAISIDGYTLASDSVQTLKLGAKTKENVITFNYVVYVAPVTYSYSGGGSSSRRSKSTKIEWG